MKELHLTAGSIFDMPTGTNTAMCVTTNGMVKRNGEAVMGAGIAKAVYQRYNTRGIASILATHLRKTGNHVYDLGLYGNQNGQFHMISFPTKNDWRDPSDLALIEQSAKELAQLCDRLGIQSCFLPRPGCSNGKLRWENVRPVIAPILDDRFTIITQDRFD